MANTSNASHFILNIVELQNTVTNAGGLSVVGTLSNSVSQLQQMINFNAKQVKADVISKYSTSPITVTDSLNLSNASLYQNGVITSMGGSASSLTAGPNAVTLVSTTAAAAAFTVTVGAPTQNPIEVLGTGAVRFPVAGTPIVGHYLTCIDSAGRAEWQPPAIPSDARLKESVEPLGAVEAAALVDALQGVRFVWSGNGERDIGLIAQEVESVVPEAVIRSSFFDGAMRIKVQTIVPILVEAIKGLQARVEALDGLQARVEALEERLSSGAT